VQQEDLTMGSWDTGTSRSGFLRRAGKTLAIGLGIALIPAARASAASAHCCPNSGCQSQCNQGDFGYSCFDACANQTCCVCLSTNPGCHDVPCGACG
jgi:hypothetical protein